MTDMFGTITTIVMPVQTTIGIAMLAATMTIPTAIATPATITTPVIVTPVQTTTGTAMLVPTTIIATAIGMPMRTTIATVTHAATMTDATTSMTRMIATAMIGAMS